MTDELVERIAAIVGDLLDDHEANRRVYARACLKEIEAAGMVVVPREPTKAMIAAGVANVAYHAHSADNSAAVWHYMVNAALTVPASPKQK